MVHDAPVALWDHSGPWRGHWTGGNGGKAAKVTSLGMDLTVRMGVMSGTICGKAEEVAW
mgnify:CR=1 FL=1